MAEAEKKEQKPPVEDPAATAAYNAIRAIRPGEPEFQLKLEPNDFVIFKSDNLINEHVTFDVKITNTSTKRQTYKVKCTSNLIFRVRPPLAYLAPGETIVIKFSCVTKTLVEPYRHFFAFYHMPSEDKRNVRFAWTANSKPEGIMRMPVKFQKMDETEYPAPEAKPVAGAPIGAGAPGAAAAPPAGAPPPPSAAKPPAPAPAEKK